jgi:hypothetical protein
LRAIKSGTDGKNRLLKSERERKRKIKNVFENMLGLYGGWLTRGICELFLFQNF